MSKLAKAKQILKDKGGLSKSAAEYVFWYLESVDLEREIRAQAGLKPSGPDGQYKYAAGVIEYQRSQVDLGNIKREEYQAAVDTAIGKLPK